MREARFAFSMGLCTFCILLAASDFLFPVCTGRQRERMFSQSGRYLLEDGGGRVTVADLQQPQASPQVCDIYVNLLPEVYALRVKAGWPVSDAAHLQALLEELTAQQVFALQQNDFSAINRKGK